MAVNPKDPIIHQNPLGIQSGELIKRTPSAPVVPAPDPVPEITEEDAAELLVSYLPEEVRSLIQEAAQTKAMPVWQLLLGYTMRCSEWGELFSPYVLPAWVKGGKPGALRACKTCGQTFASRFPSATYCCAPCHFGKLGTFGHATECPTKGVIEAVR